MMKLLLFVALQFVWSYGSSVGGGTIVYSDSQGNRYGGSYRLRDGQIESIEGDLPRNFPITPVVPFADPYAFQSGILAAAALPSYFANLGNSIQEMVHSNIKTQMEMTNNIIKSQASLFPRFVPSFPQFPPNFPFGGIEPPNFNFGPGMAGMPGMPGMAGMPGMHGFSGAAAGAAIGPDFRSQYASIYPSNPGMPNINENVVRMSDRAGPQGYSVSSNSFSSSSNINGKQYSNRGGETIVNDNGKITRYRVNN